MKVAVITDLHFEMDNEGNSYTPAMYGYEFFSRYHNIFEEVIVVARGERKELISENNLKINGEGIKTFMLPAMRGVNEYISHYFVLKKKMKQAVRLCDVAIIRTPSALSMLAVKIAEKLKKPYALEVVADPGSVKSGKSLQDRLIRAYVVKSCKKACMSANGVSYVTKHFLQSICPCRATISGTDTDEYFTADYSSVTLPEEYYGEARDYAGKNKFVIIHTANIIGSEAKGHSIVIRTAAQLRERGYEVEVCFVGDGPSVSRYKKLAQDLNIEKYVKFVGKFADPQKIRQLLMKADVYMLPSESEGLPRGVIEAMACGLVCIASNVSGIPELLDEKDMFDPKDVVGYVDRLVELFENTDEMTKESKRNLEISRLYSTANLTIKRNEFYAKLRSYAEKKQGGQLV